MRFSTNKYQCNYSYFDVDWQINITSSEVDGNRDPEKGAPNSIVLCPELIQGN